MHEGHVNDPKRFKAIIVYCDTKHHDRHEHTPHEPIVDALCMVYMHTGKKSDAIFNHEFVHTYDTLPILFAAIISSGRQMLDQTDPLGDSDLLLFRQL